MWYLNLVCKENGRKLLFSTNQIICTFGSLSVSNHAASGGSVELRTRNAKFLAELAKFGLLSASHYFDAVRACADELVSAPHTIDTVCALLETGAGRFFYAQPETHLPLVALIERMTTIKKARVHDAAQV